VKELLERERELVAVEELLKRRSGILTVEVGVGIGKTSLVQAACRRAQELGYDVLSARGSELEADFAFGAVRQLFERRLKNSKADERASLLVGPAAAVKPLLFGKSPEDSARDSHFAVCTG
jgi:hypothetical protein